MSSVTTQVFPLSSPLRSFVLFVYLQALDLLTTFVFLMNGVKEANPLVRFAIAGTPHPLLGLAIVKVGALVLALYCVWKEKLRALTYANLFFALLVVWNLVALVVQLTSVAR